MKKMLFLAAVCLSVAGCGGGGTGQGLNADLANFELIDGLTVRVDIVKQGVVGWIGTIDHIGGGSFNVSASGQPTIRFALSSGTKIQDGVYSYGGFVGAKTIGTAEIGRFKPSVNITWVETGETLISRISN